MENENKVQNQKPQKNNIVRTSILLIMSLLLIVVLFWVVSSQPKGNEISYDYFVNELNAGHIDKVELNSKQINIRTKDGSWYWLYNRESGEVSILQDCKDYNQYVKTDEGVALKLTQVEITMGTTATVNVLNIIFPILLLLSLAVVVFMFLRQVKGMNNKSMEFTKNRARVSASKVKFDKVAGADEEKAELEEIIQFLKDPDRFTKIGARIPKGVLLIGPPGTGKTLLAKAVAGEANVPFFTISGSDFMELYVGVGASRVRDLFETAKKAKPCIVFIDEIDAVGRQRGTGLGGGNDEREQTLNQLLVQMDGFETNEGIIVMAATNRADILDPALTRPGRFDRQIYINAPDVKGREEILRVHSDGKPFESDVKLKEVARVTSGFTGADLENLLNEAAILAARQDHEKISMEDINNAIVKVMLGPQKRSRVVSEKDRQITAYHEAGHAVIEKCTDNKNAVHEVSIIQRGGAAGYTMSRPETDENSYTRKKLINTITELLGGRCSEEIFLDDITAGASSDIQRATAIARKMVTEWGMSSVIGPVNFGGEGGELFLGRDYQSRTSYSEKEAAIIDAEIKKIVDDCYKKAVDIINKHKLELETMVKVLLEKETIYSDEVDMIMSGASAEDVIKYIEEKATSKKSETKKEEKEVKVETKEEKIKAGSFVESLFKEVEKRVEKQKSEKDNAEVEADAKNEEKKSSKLTEIKEKEEQPKDKEQSTSKKTQQVKKSKESNNKDTNDNKGSK